MPRAPRVDVGNQIYHVINRANARHTIFETIADYRHFESLLIEALARSQMRLIAYVIMPNHWHLVLHPTADGDLSRFMQWLTLTHTQQLRARTETIGYGHLYQGRYKSFLVDTDMYLAALIKYVERNPVRAKLVAKVEDWRWGSGHHRLNSAAEGKRILADPLIDLPENYRAWINESDKEDDIKNIQHSIIKSRPFGSASWADRIIERYNLIRTTRERGRPRKGT